jgi:hypothetical protein
MATPLLSLTGKEQSIKLSGFYGATTPVHHFEKLNQIGEGSTPFRNCWADLKRSE